jgi:hypothetical protein
MAASMANFLRLASPAALVASYSASIASCSRASSSLICLSFAALSAIAALTSAAALAAAASYSA